VRRSQVSGPLAKLVLQSETFSLRPPLRAVVCQKYEVAVGALCRMAGLCVPVGGYPEWQRRSSSKEGRMRISLSHLALICILVGGAGVARAHNQSDGLVRPVAERARPGPKR
jgi:hypothetical protein